jgi:hypothetical protein
MKAIVRIVGCIAAALCATSAVAQSVDGQEDATAVENSAAAPVAFVYATRPTHVDGFAAASNGKLTPVPGSPFSTPGFLHLSVNKEFLFGFDGTNIYSYAIASNGSLTLAATTSAYQAPGLCGGFEIYPMTLNAAGSILYLPEAVCPGNNQVIESFKIESNGELNYLGASADSELQGPLTVLGNSKYAYAATCEPVNGSDTWSPLTATYTSESSGLLKINHDSFPLPKADYPAPDYTCPDALAADPSNHLAMAEHAYDPKNGSGYAPEFLASYTADSKGNLTTSSTPKNMAQADIIGSVLSISPTGKLLAIGGGDFGTGFQIFHFNGGEQITNFSDVLQPNNQDYFSEFGWDKSNHLFALDWGIGLYVYTVTPTSIKQAPGSPYLIPDTDSLIVLVK